MTETHTRLTRRTGLVLACVLGLSACASTAPVVHDVNGLPCAAFRKTHRPNRICAALPAPSAEAEHQIKQFVPDKDIAQVLVHWLDRGGATRALKLLVDGRAVADLVPGGLVRVRLSPGAHALAVGWGEHQAVMPLQAQAGMVQFAEVGSRFKLWDISFAWEVPNRDGSRRRAMLARVIEDVDLRLKPAMDGVSVTAKP